MDIAVVALIGVGLVSLALLIGVRRGIAGLVIRGGNITIHGVLLGVGAFVALGLYAIFWLPGRLVPSTAQLVHGDRLALLNDVRTTLLQALAGLGAIVAATRTWLAVNERGQITERLTRAVDQLGNSSLEVRLGAIYGLEQVANDSTRDREAIAEIIAGYIRSRSPWPPSRPEQSSANERLGEVLPLGVRAADIQAAVTILTRTPLSEGTHRRLQLSYVDLRKVDMREGHLRRAVLDGSNLEGADMQHAHLNNASLIRTNFKNADLRGASLRQSDLKHAYFQAADLKQADLFEADLTESVLDEANLRDAQAGRARLEQAALRRAQLIEANLLEANLQRANLEGANLEGANLMHANMNEANLRGTRLAKAKAESHTHWPEGYDEARLRKEGVELLP